MRVLFGRGRVCALARCAMSGEVHTCVSNTMA